MNSYSGMDIDGTQTGKGDLVEVFVVEDDGGAAAYTGVALGVVQTECGGRNWLFQLEETGEYVHGSECIWRIVRRAAPKLYAVA